MKSNIILDGIEYVKKEDQQIAKDKKGLTYCIVRTYSAGVWAGWVDYKIEEGTCKEVFEARRLWRWWSEFTLSALAKEGQKEGKEKENKYAMPVDRVVLTQVIEMIPCTEKAKNQIIDTPNYSE